MSCSKRKRSSEDDSTNRKKFKIDDDGLATIDSELLECHCCAKLPRAEVYLCRNGHGICSECILKLDKCSYCRLSYGGENGRIRNRPREELLDSLRLDCAWKENGCKEGGLKRQELTHHESDCFHNPNPFNICSIILISGNKCSFQVTRNALQDGDEVKPFLDHMKTEHGFHIYEMFRQRSYTHWSKFASSSGLKKLHPFHAIGESNCTASSMKARHHGLIMQRFDDDDDDDKTQVGLYMIFNLVDTVDSDAKVSWVCVHLSEEDFWSSVTVKVSIKNPSTSQDSYTPQQSWKIKQIELSELKQLREGNPKDLPKFGYSLPVSQIRDHYSNDEDLFYQDISFNVN